MFGELFSPLHLLVVLVIALLVFGPGKLPELGSSMGKAIREFKKVINDPEKTLISDAEKTMINDTGKTIQK
ncbi:MAG: twin-arginine translocase TatA/TatE family subunit [Deltaproteobacteria bacterium]